MESEKMITIENLVDWVNSFTTENSFTTRNAATSATNVEQQFTNQSSNSEANSQFLSWFAWEMYHGRQLKFLPKNPAETLEEFNNRPGKGFLNLTRLTVDILASLYRNQPARKIEAATAVENFINQLYNHTSFDNTMLNADRIAKLQGLCAVRPIFSNGELFFHIYPAHSFRVLPRTDKPWEPAVIATFHEVENPGTHTKTMIHNIWTDTHFVMLENSKPVKVLKHNFSRIPFTIIRDSLDPVNFWVHPQGADIAFQNRRINVKLSDLAYTVKMQGFGVLEIVNPDPASEITLSPGRAIQFRVIDNDPYGVNFKNPNAPIAELIEDLKFDIQQLLLTYRIPETAITVNLSKAPSGAAIVAARTPLQETLIERSNLFRNYEKDLLDNVLRVIAGSKEDLQSEIFTAIENHDYSLSIDYPEPARELSLNEKNADIEFKLKNKLITPWEVMFMQNPDGFADVNAAYEKYSDDLKKFKEIEIPDAGEDYQ